MFLVILRGTFRIRIHIFESNEISMLFKKLCKTLSDYVEYTSRVREYAKELSIEEAVERAITECIKEGILAEFLKKNRAEIVNS